MEEEEHAGGTKLSEGLWVYQHSPSCWDPAAHNDLVLHFDADAFRKF